MVLFKFNRIASIAQAEEAAVLCKPFFWNYCNFPIRQQKPSFFAQNVLLKRNKWYCMCAKIDNGIDVKPIIVFLYFKLDLTFTEKKAFAAFALLNFKACFSKLQNMIIYPIEDAI